MKKLLCLVLATVLALSLVMPALAAAPAAPDAEYDGLPLVLVRGMDFTGMYFDPESENPQNILKISAGQLLAGFGRAIIRGVSEWSFDAAVDEIIFLAREILGPFACDENGDSVYDVGKKQYPLSLANYPDDGFESGTENEFGILRASMERYGAHNTYYVNYDWRRNPMDVADDIDATVNRALADSGKDKVNLVSASMGGAMTVAYLTEYGCSKVEKSIFLSSAFCGAYVVSDLFRGKIKFSGETAGNMLLSATGGSPAIRLLDKLGVFDFAARLLNKFTDKYKQRIHELVLNDVYGNMLSMWALVRPENYDECAEYMFAGKETERAAFIAKTRALQDMMRGRDAMLKNAVRDGMKIAVAAAYDSPLVPVYERADQNGDGTLETAPMLGEAVVAPYGGTLDADYIAAHPGTVSPDGVVDVSTCLFPESTWAIKGAPHVACRYGSDYVGFVLDLVDYDGQPTVRSLPQYPQFMLSGGDQSLRPAE